MLFMEAPASGKSSRMDQKIRRIGLVTCASNFERHQVVIQAVHQALRNKGPYALYVITNYGVFFGDHYHFRGDAADFSLLDHIPLDGCILESNLGSDRMCELLSERLRIRNIPVIAINLALAGVPSVNLKVTEAGRQMMKFLIEDRRCEKISLVINPGHSMICQEMLEAYRGELEKHNLPFLPERVLESLVSVQDGRNLLDRVLEADPGPGPRAVIATHDVCAIGLCLEAEQRGIRIPEDLLVCSLNYSRNSMIFRPDITGIDRRDADAVDLACDLLDQMIDGKSVPMVNHYEGILTYGASTGHEESRSSASRQHAVLQQQAVTKIEMGGQVSRMMRFNDSLEKAESLEDWARSLYETLQGMGCRGFFCCLNHDDIPFIESNREDPKTEDSPDYDMRMTVVSGYSQRTGEIRNLTFPMPDLVPVEPAAGDQFLVLPVHHASRSYGYMVFLNDDLPILQYVFRIFQESLGDTIDNLHKKMILKGNLRELDRLHMEDQMTGLYNRFALNRFAPGFIQGGPCAVVLADLDGLKTINDSYGHLAGNNAICMIAEALKQTLSQEDLILRYGGDEFLVLSKNADPDCWKHFGETLNAMLQKSAEKQQLPYSVGISVGYAVSEGGAAVRIEELIEHADLRMYRDKRGRRSRPVSGPDGA